MGWGLLTLVLVWAVPPSHIAALGALLEAADPGARSAILRSWVPDVLASLAFLIGFDFLYDVVHNNAVALIVVWGAVRRGTRRARAVGRVMAWLLWLDSALNVFENLAILHVLRSQSAESLLPAISAVFAFRSATPLLGLFVGAALHASAWRAGRPTG